MQIWHSKNWLKTYSPSVEIRKGLRLRFDKNLDSEVRRACKELCKWLRAEYDFPVRVPIYIKSTPQIESLDGEMVYATFFEPANRLHEPYIRIAAGGYHDLLKEWGDKDNAIAAILLDIAHELTHYFQWINDIKLTDIGKERQAKQYARSILQKYSEKRNHL